MKLLAVSDIHNHAAALGDLIQAAAGRHEAIVCAGDLTNWGGKRSVRKLVSMMRGLPLLVIPGNMDTPQGLELLREEGVNLHGERRQLNDWCFVGFGGGEKGHVGGLLFSEEDLTRSIDPLLREAPPERTVLVTHRPAHGTRLDRLSSGRLVGSTAIRSAIEKYTPAIHLCAHIHEAPGEDRIGDTLSVNVAGVMEGRAAIIELASRTVEWLST